MIIFLGIAANKYSDSYHTWNSISESISNHLGVGGNNKG